MVRDLTDAHPVPSRFPRPSPAACCMLFPVATSPMITVLLADDHALVRRGFRRMLEDDPGIEVVGEASDGAEAVELAQKLRPTVIVMDYAMPGLDGRIEVVFREDRVVASLRLQAKDPVEVRLRFPGSGSALVAFYPVHINKEDAHFFKPCLEYFSAAEKEQMLSDFDEFDRALIHQKYRTIVEDLEGR